MRRTVLIAAAAVLAWAAWDVSAPRVHSLRDFQPDEVGRLETAMWKSYYARERLRLFSELATLVRRQYDLSSLRSYLAGYHAARAAAVFQAGHTHADYEKALPEIMAFYEEIRRASRDPFDVESVSRRELNWWIVHRERAMNPVDALEDALAALPAELYHILPERVREHASLRAQAMVLRDAAAAAGGPTDSQWREIDRQLRKSWGALWEEVRQR